MYFSLFDAYCNIMPSMLIWVKETFVMRRNNYHSQYEVVYFGWKGSGGRPDFWFGDRKMSDVWEIERDDTADYEHPTQKPAEIPARAIKYSCPRGGVVFEPFTGSGSTIIAAQNEGRTCYAMEIDPAYCAVILERCTGAGMECSLIE